MKQTLDTSAPALTTSRSSIRNRHILFLDLLLLSLTPSAVILMRSDGIHALQDSIPAIFVFTAGAVPIRCSLFVPLGMYGRYWHSASVADMAHTIRASLLTTFAVWVYFQIGKSIPLWNQELLWSLPLVEGLFALLAVGATRFGVRALFGNLRPKPCANGADVLVIGAGVTGQSIVKEILVSPQLRLRPIGFIDDDPLKQGLRVVDLPVFGGKERLASTAADFGVNQAIIAMPTAPGSIIREYVDICESAGLSVRIVPGIAEVLKGRPAVRQLRSVEIEDLLRRDPVQTDTAAVASLLRGKRVLITGGGGSIGSELCRQVLACEPRSLALLGHGENSVFEIHNDLLRIEKSGNGVHPSRIHAPFIADIRSRERLQSIFRDFMPEVVFHAAAHKHVPLMEHNPTEAISNNILGTRNLVEMATEMGVERFVLISTDKAVNPTSIMGASKRAAEMVVLKAAQDKSLAYVAVRFGNVLGSRGSVVPVFKRQIAAGGPVTVSHPEMRRFFMTIPEAVQLVLQASVLGKGGEVFTLDMGEPVRIVDLAHDLIELSGLEVGRDIDIEFTGVRPGEKLYEELFVPGETYRHTEHEKILIAENACDFVPDRVDDTLAEMEEAVSRDDATGAVLLLRSLIPEFEPDEPHHMRAVALARKPAETGEKALAETS